MNAATSRNWLSYALGTQHVDHQDSAVSECIEDFRASAWHPANGVPSIPPPPPLDDDFADSQSADMRSQNEEISDAKTQKLIASIRNSSSTTMMIRNLPRHVKQKRLLKEIDATGFAGTYDFSYLPSSFGRGVESSGLGYAFINFEEVEVVTRFVQMWHGSRAFSMNKSDDAVTVSVAEHQGKDINVRAWMRKGVRVRNPDLRPFMKGEPPWEAFEEERLAAMAVGDGGTKEAANADGSDEGIALGAAPSAAAAAAPVPAGLRPGPVPQPGPIPPPPELPPPSLPVCQ